MTDDWDETKETEVMQQLRRDMELINELGVKREKAGVDFPLETVTRVGEFVDQIANGMDELFDWGPLYEMDAENYPTVDYAIDQAKILAMHYFLCALSEEVSVEIWQRCMEKAARAAKIARCEHLLSTFYTVFDEAECEKARETLIEESAHLTGM